MSDAVALYGPPPYPTVARAFVRDQAHIGRHIWQARMVGAGISSAELDKLLRQAHADLLARGYWWAHTLTDPTERVVDGAMVRLMQRGYTGEVYQRIAHRSGSPLARGVAALAAHFGQVVVQLRPNGRHVLVIANVDEPFHHAPLADERAKDALRTLSIFQPEGYVADNRDPYLLAGPLLLP